MSTPNTQNLKLVISGSVNAGKTTFIKTISEIEPITTDEWATEAEVKEKKSLTTVALDYGRLTVDDSLVLNIYGTPGQKRFDFMWEVLSENAFGVIFLADTTSLEDIRKTREIIDFFQTKINLPFIICLTKLDLPDTLGMEIALAEYLHFSVPVLPINTTEKEDVKLAMMKLIETVLSDLE